MEIIWLNDFLAIANSQSFSRAAEMRGVTQPAFSRRIRALENWLGTTLINRDTHRIKLTEAGARFVEIAEFILRHIELGKIELQHIAATTDATIRFATTNMLSLSFFPRWFGALQVGCGKEISIQLTADNMRATEQLMLLGKAQFLLCHHHPAAATILEQRGFFSITLDQDELIPVSAPIPGSLAPNHPLSCTPEAPTNYLHYGPDSGIGRIVSSVREASASPPHLDPGFISHAAMVLAAMAREGRGMAWLPRSLIEADLASGALVAASGNEWIIPIDVRIYRPRARQSQAAEAFWSLLCDKHTPR